MSKNEFMKELEQLLVELPKEEKEEAIQYYESYFEEAGADQEQVVLEELGSAERIASQIIRDYRMENGAGVYTEKGYQGDATEPRAPIPYTGDRKKEEQNTNGNSSSGIYVTNKGMSGGTLAAVIIIAILTFPIWISVLATAFGLLMGFFGAATGIAVGFGAGGVGCIVGGIAAFGVGIVKTFTIPVVGAALISIGLLVFGIGCLLIAATGGIIRLAVWVVNGIIKLCSRLFGRRKGATV